MQVWPGSAGDELRIQQAVWLLLAAVATKPLTRHPMLA